MERRRGLRHDFTDSSMCPVTSGEAGCRTRLPAAEVASALQKLGGEAPARRAA